MDPIPFLKKIAQLNKAIEYISFHLAQRTAGAEYIQDCISKKTDSIIDSATIQIDRMYDTLENDKENTCMQLEQIYTQKYNQMKAEYSQVIKKHYQEQKKIESAASELLKILNQFSNEVVPELLEGMKNFEKDDSIDPQIYIDMIKKKVEEHKLAIRIHDENANKKLEAFRKTHSINEEMYKTENQIVMQLPMNFRRLPARLRSSYKDFLKEQKDQISELKNNITVIKNQISGIEENMKENLTFMKANVKRITRQMHIEDKKRSDSKLQSKKSSQNQDDSMKSEINSLTNCLKQKQRDLDFKKIAVVNDLKESENKNKELKEEINNLRKLNQENNPEINELQSELSKNVITFLDDKNQIEKEIQNKISNLQDQIKSEIERKIDTSKLENLKSKNSNDLLALQQRHNKEIDELQSIQNLALSEKKSKVNEKVRKYKEYQHLINEKNIIQEQLEVEERLSEKQKNEKYEIERIKKETPGIVQNESQNLLKLYNEAKENAEKSIVNQTMLNENEIIKMREELYNRTVQEITDFPKKYEEIPELETIKQEYSEMIALLLKEYPFLGDEDLPSVQNRKVDLIKKISKEKRSLLDNNEEKYNKETKRHEEYLKELSIPGSSPTPFFVLESSKKALELLDTDTQNLNKELNELKDELKLLTKESRDEEISSYQNKLQLEKEKSEKLIQDIESKYDIEKSNIEKEISYVIQENNGKEKISYELAELYQSVLNQKLTYLRTRDFSPEGIETMFSKIENEYRKYRNEKQNQIQEIKHAINTYSKENRIQREKMVDDNDQNINAENATLKESITQIKANRDSLIQEYDEKIMKLKELRAKQRLNPPPVPISKLEEELEEKEYNLNILLNELEGMKQLVKNRPASEASDIESLKPIVVVKNRPKTSLSKRPVLTTPNL